MPNPNTFDEASAATQDLFAQEQLSLEDATLANEETIPVESEQTENTPADTSPTKTEEQPTGQQSDALEKAAQTAEVAAQVAAEKDGQLQQAIVEIENLKQQNQQLQGTIDEMSRQNTDEIIEEALTPPTLDINSLAFADEETQKAEVEKFVEGVTKYNRQQLMKEMSPAIEFAKKGMREAETKEVVAALSQIPELSNIQEVLPQLDRLIANNKWLQSEDMPLDEKYINAYAMLKGIDTINNPPAQPETAKGLTPEELLQMYNNNPAFQELVEKQRIDNLKHSQQVPPFSASSGAVNAALNIKEKPQTLEEASKRTREMFRTM